MTCNPETVLQRRGHIYEASTITAIGTNTKTVEISGVDDFHLLEGTRLLVRFVNGNSSTTMRLVVDGVTADLTDATGNTTWAEDTIAVGDSILVTYDRTNSLFKATELYRAPVSLIQFKAADIKQTPKDGLLEYDGTHLYFTIGSTRSIIK